jgi:hypothetical protein
MNKKNENKTIGLGFFDALTLLFIALKLTGYITWSWLWVLSPWWITFIVAAIFAVISVLRKK